jgi:hypothetical protein
MADEPRVASLNRIFQDDEDQDTHIGRRLKQMVHSSVRSETPPFPRQIQIETSNICNHACSFCAYPAMKRPHRHMDRELFRRIVSEAYALGAREIGLFAGAEPLACKWLEEHIAYCQALGYEYMYISTNGSLGTPARFRALIDAGLSSIKFSINAGTRETYRQVHGRDNFDLVIANLASIAEYRRICGRPIYLGVSFVGMDNAAEEFSKLKELVSPWVDELLFYEANNQSGQVEGLPLVPFTDCSLPFNKLHISVEGFIKACCNDYDNLLAVDEIAEIGLAAAWHSPRFRQLRRRHLDDRLEGTLCGKCIRGDSGCAKPINEALLSPPVRAALETSSE